MRAQLRTRIVASTLLAAFAVALAGCGRDDTAPGFDDTDPIEPAAPDVPPAAPGNSPGAIPDGR